MDKAVKSTKMVPQTVKQMMSDVLKNRKDANKIIDLIGLTKSNDVSLIKESVHAIHHIFNSFIRSGAVQSEPSRSDEQDDPELSKEEKYTMWLCERYSDCLLALAELLQYPTYSIQELALVTLMKLISEECNHPPKNTKNSLFFPASHFEPIVISLMSHKQDCTQLITRFQEYMEFDDVRYFSMKFALKELQRKSSKTDASERSDADIYHNNLFCLLKNLSMPQSPENDSLTNFMSNNTVPNSKNKLTSYQEGIKLFTTLWLEFLNQKMSARIYKEVLVILHDKVMPFMTNPLLLSDFFTQSYDIGGVTSLLALNGIFILVNKYNLEYPDFYKKLYSLLDPGVFHVKYRARFFFLVDLFLTSTHLPAYVVAAFAKKLSRLSLTAPPSGLTIIIPFIYNLINRHPNCRKLIHSTDSHSNLLTDPYNMNEMDPMKCNALESSLWELETLQEHYHYSVSTEARKIAQLLSKDEIDLSPLLETTTAEMFAKEAKKKMKADIATTYLPVKGLFENKEDRFADLWSLN